MPNAHRVVIGKGLVDSNLDPFVLLWDFHQEEIEKPTCGFVGHRVSLPFRPSRLHEVVASHYKHGVGQCLCTCVLCFRSVCIFVSLSLRCLCLRAV